jgi:hypothetical protein
LFIAVALRFDVPIVSLMEVCAMKRHVKAGAALAAIAWTASATPASAYLDPGTGSMLLQMILGGVAGALVVGKLYWQRIKDFVARRPAGPHATDDPAKR